MNPVQSARLRGAIAKEPIYQQLWRGQIPLRQTFWQWWVGANFGLTLATASTSHMAVHKPFLTGMMLYDIVALVGLYRSASNYIRSKIIAHAVHLFVFAHVALLPLFYIGYMNEPKNSDKATLTASAAPAASVPKALNKNAAPSPSQQTKAAASPETAPAEIDPAAKTYYDKLQPRLPIQLTDYVSIFSVEIEGKTVIVRVYSDKGLPVESQYMARFSGAMMDKECADPQQRAIFKRNIANKVMFSEPGSMNYAVLNIGEKECSASGRNTIDAKATSDDMRLAAVDAPKEAVSQVSIPQQEERPREGSIRPPGTTLRVTMSYLGCSGIEEMERILELGREGDPRAQVAYAMENRCTLLEAGTVVRVEKDSMMDGLMCIRPQGRPDCMWFPPPLTSSLN